MRATSVVVELVDLGGVLLQDGSALELHRGRQLVAGGLPVLAENGEPFDLLDASKAQVRPGDALLQLTAYQCVRRERSEVVSRQPMLFREGRCGFRVEHDERDVV